MKIKFIEDKKELRGLVIMFGMLLGILAYWCWVMPITQYDSILNICDKGMNWLGKCDEVYSIRDKRIQTPGTPEYQAEQDKRIRIEEHEAREEAQRLAEEQRWNSLNEQERFAELLQKRLRSLPPNQYCDETNQELINTFNSPEGTVIICKHRQYLKQNGRFQDIDQNKTANLYYKSLNNEEKYCFMKQEYYIEKYSIEDHLIIVCSENTYEFAKEIVIPTQTRRDTRSGSSGNFMWGLIWGMMIFGG